VCKAMPPNAVKQLKYDQKFKAEYTSESEFIAKSCAGENF